MSLVPWRSRGARRLLVGPWIALLVLVVTAAPVAALAGWQGPGSTPVTSRSGLAASAMDSGNRMHAVWEARDGLFYGSRTPGAAWSIQRVTRGIISDGVGDSDFDPAISVHEATGKVYIAFTRNLCPDCTGGGDDRVHVVTNARGLNSDGTWKQILASTGGADRDGFASIRVRGDRVHLAFSRDGVGVVYRFGRTVSPSVGPSWQAGRVIASVPATFQPWVDAMTSMRIDGAGDIHVLYQHTGTEPEYGEPIQAGLRYVEYRPSTGAALRRSTLTSSEATQPNLILDGNGRPHAAYIRPEGSSRGTWYRALVNGTWTAAERVSTAFGSVRLTVDANDVPAVVVSDADGVYFKKRRMSTPSALWPKGADSDNFRVSKFGRDAELRIDSMNKAHILFANPTGVTIDGIYRRPGTYAVRQI
jgi:hypothetical protein